MRSVIESNARHGTITDLRGRLAIFYILVEELLETKRPAAHVLS